MVVCCIFMIKTGNCFYIMIIKIIYPLAYYFFCLLYTSDSVGRNQMKRVVKGPRLCNEIPVVRIGIFPVGADDQQVHTL